MSEIRDESQTVLKGCTVDVTFHDEETHNATGLTVLGVKEGMLVVERGDEVSWMPLANIRVITVRVPAPAANRGVISY